MKVSELFEASLYHEGFAIKDGSWYSEQMPTLGPVKGGITESLESELTDAVKLNWSVDGFTEKKVQGVPCAAARIRVTYAFTKDDDIGLDIKDGESVSDSQSIFIARNPKSPKKYIFAGYAH